jgi:HK97 family phage major capsid protein
VLGSSSNAFIAPEQATIWYDRLRNASVFLQANPLQVDVQDTQLNIPRVSGSGTVAMIAENTAFTASDPTFAQVSLVPKKAYYYNIVSNEALDDSTPALQEVLATAFTRDLGTLIDTQLLTGNGTAPNLRGAINFTGATSQTNGANGLQVSAQTNLDFLATPLGTLQSLNADLSRAAWFFHPLQWAQIRKVKDSQGRYQLQPWGTEPSSDITPRVFGIPVFITANLPSAQTVGTSTDCTTAVLADMSQIAVGWRKQITLEMRRDFLFNADQTAIRLIARLDVQPVNAAATVVITGLRAS